MTNRRRGQSAVMRPRLISVQNFKAGYVIRVGEQYATGIRSSGRSSYLLVKSNKKKINLPPFLHGNPYALDAIKTFFVRIYMVYQYRNFMNILTNE